MFGIVLPAPGDQLCFQRNKLAIFSMIAILAFKHDRRHRYKLVPFSYFLEIFDAIKLGLLGFAERKDIFKLFRAHEVRSFKIIVIGRS